MATEIKWDCDGKVVQDLVPSASGVVRRVELYGIVAPTSDLFLWNAANDAALPALGSDYPSDSGLKLKRREASKGVVMGAASVDLIYAPYNPPTTLVPPIWEFDGFLSQVDTSYDKDNARITVSYTPPGGSAIDQTGTVSTQIPLLRMRGTRLETTSPYTKIKTYLGKTNSDTFGGEAARRWLVSAISGRSGDEGTTWEVMYELLLLGDLLDSEVRWIDEATGNPPDDITVSNGTTTAAIYPEIAYSGLSLE